MNSNNYFFDDNLTRHQLVKSNPGKTFYNWIFLPGGPGVDSNYLSNLINKLDMDGDYCLLDLPLNGSNLSKSVELDTKEIYRNWGKYIIKAIDDFDNPILVGHSFGGYYPLFFPELEHMLSGFVILNSSPTIPATPKINTQEFEQLARKNNLPLVSETTESFLKNPTIENITNSYLSLVPYLFPEESIAYGASVMKNLLYNVDANYWWVTEGCNKYAEIKWIPEKIPLLIIGGSHDFLTPLSTFEEDLRFHRSNIEIVNIPNAGHFPWLEQPTLVRDAFFAFMDNKVSP